MLWWAPKRQNESIEPTFDRPLKSSMSSATCSLMAEILEYRMGIHMAQANTANRLNPIALYAATRADIMEMCMVTAEIDVL